MRDYTMFNFNFLFNDHFAKVSNQAKLYYIKLCFFADRGFVPNPLSVLDSLGFDKGVYWELIKNEEILTLPDRDEIFITSYFLHNPGLKSEEIHFSPFWIYWRTKLHMKKNGVATFKPEGLYDNSPNLDPLAKVKAPNDSTQVNQSKAVDNKVDEDRWDKMISDIENYKGGEK